MANLLASMRFNRVEEVSAVVLGADQADPIQGSVIQSKLVRLHLQKQKKVPRTTPLQSNQLVVLWLFGQNSNSPQGHSCFTFVYVNSERCNN